MRIKLKLKKIDPVKSGVIYALLMVLISLIVVVPMFLVMSAAGLSSGGDVGIGLFGGGIAMIIFMPILYGVFGFIFGLIGTALLNFILSKTNGLDIEFENENIEISQIGQKENELKF